MTTFQLSFIIFAALTAQLAVFIAIAFYRQWLSFQELKKQLAAWESSPEQYYPQEILPAPPIKMAWQGFRDFKVSRKCFEDKNSAICSFYLSPVDGKPLPAFKPGQYLTFQLEIPDKDSGKLTSLFRCYSLSDQPNPDYYRVTIKKIPAGISSVFFHEQVQEGSILKVKAPAGHFYLEPEGKNMIVLIAGGIGITPLLSMLSASIHSQRDIWFYYGVRNSDEQIMKPYLEKLAEQYKNFHLYTCYSRPKETDKKDKDYQHSGHVDITLLRLTLLLKPYHFYICGSKQMMESLVPDLSAWGVPDANIHYESFGPASIVKPHKPISLSSEIMSALTIHFSQSGKTLPWDNKAACLLEFAEQNQIAVHSGCRAGSCGACQTRLESGEVDYHKVPDFDPKPGHCLLCISTPKTDLTLAV